MGVIVHPWEERDLVGRLLEGHLGQVPMTKHCTVLFAEDGVEFGAQKAVGERVQCTMVPGCFTLRFDVMVEDISILQLALVFL